jgi:DNA-binding NarL/FixJ family response regulator
MSSAARLKSGLTPSEQRVAELVAKGMTNRDVAAELFISPKTVEANLSVFTASSASTRGRSSAAE